MTQNYVNFFINDNLKNLLPILVILIGTFSFFFKFII